MAMYGFVNYWDQRYSAWPAEDAPYEWYQSYNGLRHLLNPIHFAAQSSSSGSRPHQTDPFPRLDHNNMNPAHGISSTNVHAFPSRELAKVLILGCGHSTFGEDMQRDGWTGEIVNVDFSSVVIKQMKDKYNGNFYSQPQLARARPMQFVCADMTQRLPFPDNYFDLIVCKGSLDAVLCSVGNKINATRVVKESVRLLASGYGIFFLVTHGNPDNRIELLEYENSLEHYWYGVNIFNVTRPVPPGSNNTQRRTDYVYICRKRLEDSVPCNDTSSEILGTQLPSTSTQTMVAKKYADESFVNQENNGIFTPP